MPSLLAQARAYADAVLYAYANIFFLHDRRAGAIVMATTFLDPHCAVAGLVAVLAAYAFGGLIGVDRSFLSLGFYTYNPLLAGMAVGSMFRVTPATLVLAAVAGVLAFVVATALHALFATRFRLPVLSSPFALVAILVSLAAGKYSGLYVAAAHPPVHWGVDLAVPMAVQGFLQTLGGVVFLPDVLAGAVLAVMLAAWSRILLVLAVAGYFFGTAVVATLTGSGDLAMRDANHFNFILVAMAVGGVFLVPSRRSFIVAMVAVAATSVVVEAMAVFGALFGIGGFTVPFNAVTLLFVSVLGLVGFPKLAVVVKATPEATLDHHLAAVRRFRRVGVGLALPFSGRWSVWQGFDGAWTHRGAWRHAYDFVLRGADGRTFSGSGTALVDYHAFGKPVLSPLRGRVLTVVADLPDNVIGQIDSANNWGNLVLLQDLAGVVVCVAHFAQDTIRVTEGDWVERGAMLGLCGNSGHSPQPHIHIQAQAGAAVGAATIPFNFVSYLGGTGYHAEGLPATGAAVEPCFPDRRMESHATFVLDDSHHYTVTRKGAPVGVFSYVVRCAVDGTYYLDSGRGQLYVGARDGTFHVYGLDGCDPYLTAMFLALPSLPLVAPEELTWDGHLPLGIAVSGAAKAALLLAAAFVPAVADIRYRLHRKNARQITGSVVYPLVGRRRATAVEFDATAGLRRIQVDDLVLLRIDTAPAEPRPT